MKKDTIFQHLFIDYYSATPKYLQLANSIIKAIGEGKIQKDELLPSIVNVGGYFRMRLTELARQYSFIKEIRGPGLMIGVELEFSGKQLVLDGMKEGLLFNCTHDTVLRFLPPYILTEQDVDRAIAGLSKLFKNAKRPAA